MLCCCKNAALSDTATKCVERHNGKRRRLCSKCSNSVTDSNPSCFRPPTSVQCDCRGDVSFRKQRDGNKRDGARCAHDGDDGWKSQASECCKHNTGSLFFDAGDSGTAGSFHITTAEPAADKSRLVTSCQHKFHNLFGTSWPAHPRTRRACAGAESCKLYCLGRRAELAC